MTRILISVVAASLICQASAQAPANPPKQTAAQASQAYYLKGQAAEKAGDAEAAKQFEGMLMANLFQCMRKTVSHSDLFGGGGSARSSYEYLLDQAVVTHAMDAGKGWGLSQRLQDGWKLEKAKVTTGI